MFNRVLFRVIGSMERYPHVPLVMVTVIVAVISALSKSEMAFNTLLCVCVFSIGFYILSIYNPKTNRITYDENPKYISDNELADMVKSAGKDVIDNVNTNMFKQFVDEKNETGKLTRPEEKED